MPLPRNKTGKRSKDREFRIMRTALNLPAVAPATPADHGTLSGLGDDDHSQYAHLSQAENVLGQWTFDPSSTQAPFLLGSNAQGQLVTDLNADELDGFHASATPGNSEVVATDASGYIQVSRVGIGTAPSSLLHLRSTTSQKVRIDYDGTNYMNINVNSAGFTSIVTTGSGATLALVPESGQVNVTGRLEIMSVTQPQLEVKYDNDNRLDVEISADGGTQFETVGTDDWLNLTSPFVGVGDALFVPNAAALETRSTSAPQFQVGYDGSNYFQASIDDIGNTTLEAVGSSTLEAGGSIFLDPAGNQVDPVTNYDISIGQINKKYLTLHAAELWVETLVAQDTMATIGGRILVGPTTILAVDQDSDVLQGSNSLTNGGFETAGGGGADVFGTWTEYEESGDTLSRDAAINRGGVWSCKMETDGVGPHGETYIKQTISVTADTPRRLLYWTRTLAVDSGSRGYFRIYDLTNTADIVAKTLVTYFGQTWTEETQEYIVPAGCTQVEIYFYGPGTGSGTCYFEDTTDHLITSDIQVEHNQMAVGDMVYMEASAKIEFMEVVSGPTGGGPYTYGVYRDRDATGRNNWYAGDAVFNTGATSDGFIDLYSVNGLTSGTTGPTIVGNVRTGTAYNAWIEHWAIGNLKGIYGYGADTYGAAFGEYQADYITIEPTNGIRLYTNNTVMGHWETDGDFTLGEVAEDKGNLFWDNTDESLYFRLNEVKHVGLISTYTGAGSPAFAMGPRAGNAGGNAVIVSLGTGQVIHGNTAIGMIAMQGDSGTLTVNSENFGQGDVMIGNNSGDKSNIYWDYDADTFMIRSGTISMLEFDVSWSGGNRAAFMIGEDTSAANTTGFVVATGTSGAGATVWDNTARGFVFIDAGGNQATVNSQTLSAGDILFGNNSSTNPNIFYDHSLGELNFRSGNDRYLYVDSGGIRAEVGTSYDYNTSYEFVNSNGTTLGGFQGYYTAGTNAERWFVEDLADRATLMEIHAQGYYSEDCQILMKNMTYTGSITLNSFLYLEKDGIDLGYVVRVPAKIYVGGETANSKQTTGVTIFNGAQDEALSLKGDGTHDFTDVNTTETDTYFAVAEISSTDAGANVLGYGESYFGILIQGFAELDDSSTPSTSTNSPVRFNAWDHNGTTGAANPGSDQNIFAFRSGADTQFIIRGDGRIYSNASTGTSTMGNFDEYDDMALITGARALMHPEGDAFRERFRDWAEYARPILQENDIIYINDGKHGLPDDGSMFINHTAMHMLTWDTMRQMFFKFTDRIGQLEQTLLDAGFSIPELEA